MGIHVARILSVKITGFVWRHYDQTFFIRAVKIFNELWNVDLCYQFRFDLDYSDQDSLIAAAPD